MTWTVISTSFQLRIHVVCLKGFSVWKTKINVTAYATYFVLLKFWLTEIPLKRVSFKKEMYNTMNSYYKYTSIPKSSFNKLNILILPINTGEKFLKYFIHYASKSLPSSGTRSEIERLTSKNSVCNHTLLNRQNQKFQLLMADIL